LSNRDGAAAQGREVLLRAFSGHAALGKKDLAAALKSAEELGLSLPGAECSAQLIEAVYLKDY
jgi:3-hydroxyisobutyrate dehydrogenase-like beta-hydroxyacid dehydrogenase